MKNLLFIDVEATGKDDEDRLCQVAYRYNGEDCNELFNPPLPIKLPAMAVHHIPQKDVDGKPKFKGSSTAERLKQIDEEGGIFVAHNAQYDLGMFAKEGITFKRHICTLKIARYIDSDGTFENHQLQYLRYFYGVDIEAVAHDAFGDIVVLEAVYRHLVDEFIAKEFAGQDPTHDEVINRMIEISTQPSLVTRINFGKYNGKTVAEVAKIDRGYLEWLQSQKLVKPDGEDDWLYTLKHYLN